MTGNDLLITLVVSSLTIFLVLALVVALLVASSNRQHTHRVQLAEAELRREQDVMQTERETVHHTLHEVGMELHDNVCQLLSMSQIALSARLLEMPGDKVVAGALEGVQHALVETRRLSHTLVADMWRSRTLVDAMRLEAQRLERMGTMTVVVEVFGTLPALGPEVSTALYRVFQEAVNNAVKHSGSDTLEVTLSATPVLALVIADHGRGFDLATAQQRGGLSSIPQRCARIGFTAACTSSPGNGCTWRIQQRAMGAA